MATSIQYTEPTRQPTEANAMYPVALMAAASLKAFEQNKNEIEKVSTSETTRVDSNGNTVIFPAVKSNRRLMEEFLKTPEVLDVEAGQAAIEFVQSTITLNLMLGKKVSQFSMKMANALQQETVAKANIGMFVYFAIVYNSLKKASDIREKTIEYLNSEYFGKIGEKLTLDITVIDAKWISQFSKFSVFGYTSDNNLVSFFTAKEDCTKSGRYTCKVKRHEQSPWHENAKITCLNFVKLIDTK